jgi:hypothetical protein
MTNFESGIGKQVSVVASAPMERTFERASPADYRNIRGTAMFLNTTAKTSSWITDQRLH